MDRPITCSRVSCSTEVGTDRIEVHYTLFTVLPSPHIVLLPRTHPKPYSATEYRSVDYARRGRFMESPAGQLDVSNVRPTLSRIRFPTDSSYADKSSKGGQGQVGMNQSDGSGFKSRPLPYLSPSSMENPRSSELSNESNRRRVRSVNTASVLSHASPTRSRIASATAAASGNGRGGAHRRVVSHHSSRAGAGTSLQQRMTSLDSSLMYSSQSTATHEGMSSSATVLPNTR